MLLSIRRAKAASQLYWMPATALLSQRFAIPGLGFHRRTYLTFSRGFIEPTSRVPGSQAELGSAYPLRNGLSKLTRARFQSPARLVKGPSFEFSFVCHQSHMLLSNDRRRPSPRSSRLSDHSGRHSMHVVEKCLELAGARGVAQLAQRLGFDLANAFAGDGERPANFLQRVLQAILQTKTHLDHLLFTCAEGVQHVRGLFLQFHVDDGFGG